MYCKTTLCWTCGNAVGGGCSWSESLTPVRGWEAVREMESYTVLRCPEYQRDSFGDGLYRDGNDYYRMIGNRLHRMEVKQKRESV